MNQFSRKSKKINIAMEFSLKYEKKVLLYLTKQTFLKEIIKKDSMKKSQMYQLVFIVQ